ncbi:hypothetical protein Pcinc_036019 [Petrolisthes cinctipes]|uniref:Uncharacterized protein n=1 Tax=Petrolisthes cinctipes TaxID=88211 RepID=A0AAE1BYK1_PETCI|nr:hypothetical protein Pcinc_036019 [Petrolisthes cinctipes]
MLLPDLRLGCVPHNPEHEGVEEEGGGTVVEGGVGEGGGRVLDGGVGEGGGRVLEGGVGEGGGMVLREREGVRDALLP